MIIALQVVGFVIWLVGELAGVWSRRRGDTTTEITETHPALWTIRSAVAVWLPFHWLIDGTIGASWAWDLITVGAGLAAGAATYRHRRGAQ